MSDSKNNNPLKEMIGAVLEGISSSEHSYVGVNTKGVLKTTSVSLLLDRGRFELENHFRVSLGEVWVSSRTHAVTEALNSLIGKKVVEVSITNKEIVLGFEGDACIRISLKDEDYTGPEAGNYAPNSGT